MMRGIPAALLPHKVILKKLALKGTLADVYTETELSHVRVELDERFGGSKNGESRSRGGTLYYDCAASLPRGIRFAAGQKIVFDGKEYELAEIKCGATDKPVFYRIALV